MAAALRRIAVYVDEPEKGWFAWALAEQDEDLGWAEVETAEEWTGTYRETMAEGLLALQQPIEDLDAGPRAKADRPAVQKARKPPSGPFGFGGL